ncbi:hypothetical protein D9615_003253 [Tricholomella constricta]|uniref:MYND-type domain-containing protein n=1 Tax=Tricholomella constricta TaxID=117010 RepID=A0A8H5HJS5_9AGAR|nr:hypothetical protein D9615_003253 [Tricholomella constricta]
MATAMHAAHHAIALANAAAALRRGEPLDGTQDQMCLACYSFEEPGKKLFQCSGCKVALYCSEKCATMHWKGINGLEGHRDVCKDLKAANLRTPEMQAIAKQFPWTQLEKDGTYTFEPFLTLNGLLGSGPEFGWWSQIPCCADDSRYVSGFLLLEDEYLREDVGWRLRSDHVPWLDFDLALGIATPPNAPPPQEHSWKKYYAWRNLPMESVAMLLLQWPLSVYRLLHLLGLASVPLDSNERRHLTVHLLGVEKELDALPVFGELALLLPNTDLDLVLFGPGVSKLTAKAQARPSCIASRPFVYTYKAPKVAGGGTIRIELSRAGIFYDSLNFPALRREKPDALLALNAFFPTNSEWRAVAFASRALGIPFALTDICETTLRSDVRLLLTRLPILQIVEWPMVILTEPEQRRVHRADRVESYAIDMNPFMTIGPMPQATRIGPISYNGFTLVVTPGRAVAG